MGIEPAEDEEELSEHKMEVSECDDPEDRESSWPFNSRYTSTTLLLSGFALLIRILVSIHPYSGKFSVIRSE